jgi:hypothetical protein
MAVDFEFMKSSYACIKTATCDKCDIHTAQMVLSPVRSSNNRVYFCPAPEKKADAKASGGWKKSRAAAAAKA